jgi:hypothetical protein
VAREERVPRRSRYGESRVSKNRGGRVSRSIYVREWPQKEDLARVGPQGAEVAREGLEEQRW